MISRLSMGRATFAVAALLLLAAAVPALGQTSDIEDRTRPGKPSKPPRCPPKVRAAAGTMQWGWGAAGRPSQGPPRARGAASRF